MENLKLILEEAGLTFKDVVKCTIFLRDMSDFGAVNEVYGSYFDENAPARETVAVVGLPKNVNVEISCIACFTGTLKRPFSVATFCLSMAVMIVC